MYGMPERQIRNPRFPHSEHSLKLPTGSYYPCEKPLNFHQHIYLGKDIMEIIDPRLQSLYPATKA
jgi:hypothetical protein